MRLFLERVEHVDSLGVSHGVDCSVRVSRVVFDNFKDPGTTESTERFCRGIFTAHLSNLQGMAHSGLNLVWELTQILTTGANPVDRLEPGVGTNTNFRHAAVVSALAASSAGSR
jgi:hypothetical protein